MDETLETKEDMLEEAVPDEDIRQDPRFKRTLVRPNYSPVEVLLAKLERWLVQQPEWAYILAAPRRTRREAITLLSKRLLTIPNRYSNFGGTDASE